MITIRFTQCAVKEFHVTLLCRDAETLPIIPRCEFYEKALHDAAQDDRDAFFGTHDEHLILIAQCLKRKGVIKDLTLVSVCSCNGKYDERVIPIDDEGDCTEDAHHGFFPQRLKYLR